jgi:alpha-beta hydrolase superfamily lysophospholipase
MRKFGLALAGLALLAVAWLASGFVALHQLRSRERPRFAESVPTSHVDRIEPVRLRTTDGEELGAWYMAGRRDDAPSVIELHGKGGTRLARLGAADLAQEVGCAVLLVTLRGHGDSSGEREDFGWSARHDVIAAVDWIANRRPGRPVLLHGTSLGAAAAVFAGEELGPAVDGYALECLYTDLESAARNRCETVFPPVLDRLAAWGLVAAAWITWPRFREIAPIEAIARIPSSTPILLIAGGDDVHARPAEVAALRDRVAAHARLVVIDGAPHDRLQSAAPAAYRQVMHDWLRRFSAPSPR